MKGAKINVGNPVVNFCESVSEHTDIQCVSKSPNKHNRLYFSAEPIDEGLIHDIETDVIKMTDEAKIRARYMADKYGWDVTEARKIWAFGCPPDGKGNILSDTTKAAQFLSEIKDSLSGAFTQATAEGVFAEESLRGIRFNLEDVVLHADAIHRGAGQLMPAARRVFAACQIRSGPKLMEPLYAVEIAVNQSHVSGVYNTLNQRRGIVEKETQRPGTPMTKIQALLPVMESFGFTELLRKNTAGQAFPQMMFSHFEVVPGLITDEGSMANKIIMDVRARKGMKPTLPVFGDYYDKV
jgi:elongation factor 2